MKSVGFFFRLGVAIEKFGQHVAKIGRGTKVHPKPRDNTGLSCPAEVMRDLHQSNLGDPIGNVALRDQVNHNRGLAMVDNVELLRSQVNFAGLSHKQNLYLDASQMRKSVRKA